MYFDSCKFEFNFLTVLCFHNCRSYTSGKSVSTSETAPLLGEHSSPSTSKAPKLGHKVAPIASKAAIISKTNSTNVKYTSAIPSTSGLAKSYSLTSSSSASKTSASKGSAKPSSAKSTSSSTAKVEEKKDNKKNESIEKKKKEEKLRQKAEKEAKKVSDPFYEIKYFHKFTNHLIPGRKAASKRGRKISKTISERGKET